MVAEYAQDNEVKPGKIAVHLLEFDLKQLPVKQWEKIKEVFGDAVNRAFDTHINYLPVISVLLAPVTRRNSQCFRLIPGAARSPPKLFK
jgi:hypothetical protein